MAVSNPDQPTSFEFGAFRLIPSERQLLRDATPVPLPPKAFELLVLLVEKSGHLIEKEELIQKLWPDSFVEEANLTHHIWTLRKALGRKENGQNYIEMYERDKSCMRSRLFLYELLMAFLRSRSKLTRTSFSHRVRRT
jgi:DNA-binding winged helix-turn-helix (wHTH) protein